MSHVVLRKLSLLAVATLVGFTGVARAEDEFEVSVASGSVVVKSKGGWHINAEYPWKLTAGDVKLDKTKWKLETKLATISAPKGKAKIRGGVCSEGQCVSFEKDVDVQ